MRAPKGYGLSAVLVRVWFLHSSLELGMFVLQEANFFTIISKGPVIRATFFFNLSHNIVALQVEIRYCAYYRVRDQLVSQHMKCCNLRNPGRMIGQLCVNKYGGFQLFLFGREHLPLCLGLLLGEDDERPRKRLFCCLFFKGT